MAVDPYDAISKAVMMCACTDWLNAKIGIFLGNGNAKNQGTVYECEDFFKSEWCYILSSAESSDILASLEKRFERNIAFIKYLNGVKTPLAVWQRKYREKLGDEESILRSIATTYDGMPLEARKKAREMMNEKGYTYNKRIHY